MKPKQLTTGQAGKLLGVSLHTIRRLVDNGYLKAHRLPSMGKQPGQRRIEESELIEFANRHYIPLQR